MSLEGQFHSRGLPGGIISSLAGSILVCLFVVLATGCRSSRSGPVTSPPPSALYPPIYEGGQIGADQTEPSGQSEPARRITFVTADPPDKILRFYDDILVRDE